jgi:hypothetical protein
VDKDIPSVSEKTSRAARLREASRQLKSLPLDRPAPSKIWESLSDDLSQDDFEQLAKMAQGHLSRAVDAVKDTDVSLTADEARSAVLLKPLDMTWAGLVVKTLKDAKWAGAEAFAFYSAVDKRRGRRASPSVPRWMIPAVIVVLAVPLTVWAVLVLGPALHMGPKTAPVQGPRDLPAAFDTQGVKTNIQIAQSHLLLYPEATVAELSAWVIFPEDRLEMWEGTVNMLDAEGQTLAKRDVTFRSSSQGPLEAGQGMEIFQQFDAWPWFDKVASFQVSTTRILAQPTQPKNRVELPVSGIDKLESGYAFKVWVTDSHWSDRFVSKVQTLSLEIENTGLKPFNALQFRLFWRSEGKTLKTLSLRPVSSNRMALPSGGRLGLNQDTVFDTEVFSWTPGSEPVPTLELVSWR